MNDLEALKNTAPLKKAFKKQGWKGIFSLKALACINKSVKGEYTLYNYNDNVLVARNNPVLVKCRGLVVRKDGKIVNMPFERFFNSFEKECASIDWNTAQVQEKVDGSLISLWWDDINKEWEVTTRGSFYPQELSEVNFKEEFLRVFGKENLEKLSKNYSWVFELVSKKNRIVTWYDEEFTVLLGARNLKTLKEANQHQLDVIALSLNARRPKTFEAKNIEQCKKLFLKLKPDDEGLVVVDANFNRMKMKQDSYIKMAKIKMLKPQDLFDYMLGKVELDVEFLEKCPEVKTEIEYMGIIWNEVLQNIKVAFDIIKEEPSRKDFAREALRYKYSGILFKMLDGADILKLSIKWEDVLKWKI